MQLTLEQTAFVNFARSNRKKHIAVVANAGSGKSTTIAEYVNDLEGVNVLICSFSKQACESIQPKLEWAKAETLHAACRRWILKSKNWRTINIDTRKYKNILKNLIAEKEDIYCDLSKYEQDQVLARVDYIREYGSVDKPDHFDDKHNDSDFAPIQYVELELESEMGSQQLFDDLARKILTVYNKPNVFDFTDLLCYVADPNNKIVFEQFKEFILDEAQDLSPLQVKVIKRFIGETGARFIMVGDPNQCIYGFMGANILTFNNLISFFECETFELTECFRVPDTLLNLAREYVPTIRSNISVESSVSVPPTDLLKTDFVRENETAFLFRTNSDLFSMFSEFYELGIVPIINCTFNPWKAYYMAQHLKIYDVRQCNDELSPEWKFFNVNESGIIFRIFSEILGITTLKELAGAIDSYLKDADAKKDNSNCKLILSTIHRAKGAEFDYVVLFMDKPDQFTHKMKNEDNNLYYVGITRAKKGMLLHGDL